MCSFVFVFAIYCSVVVALFWGGFPKLSAVTAEMKPGEVCNSCSMLRDVDRIMQF